MTRPLRARFVLSPLIGQGDSIQNCADVGIDSYGYAGRLLLHLRHIGITHRLHIADHSGLAVLQPDGVIAEALDLARDASSGFSGQHVFL